MGANGKNSGLYHGTKGNPQERLSNNASALAVAEKRHYKAKHAPRMSKPANLTRSMKKRIAKGDNLIRDHCKEKDFSGIRAQKKGIPILKKNGVEYNHIQEARETIAGLDSVIISLEGSLKNPKLDKALRSYLERKVKRYKAMRGRLDEALKGE